MTESKKNEKNKYIKRLKDFPPEHAYMAFKEGFYYEAIGVLHGYIECQLRELLLSFSVKNQKSNYREIWDINERIDFRNLSNVLLVINQISKKEFDILCSLNSLRNEIVHKYFYEPYDKIYQGVSKKKYLSIFKPSYELSYSFIMKIAEVLEK